MGKQRRPVINKSHSKSVSKSNKTAKKNKHVNINNKNNRKNFKSNKKANKFLPEKSSFKDKVKDKTYKNIQKAKIDQSVKDDKSKTSKPNKYSYWKNKHKKFEVADDGEIEIVPVLGRHVSSTNTNSSCLERLELSDNDDDEIKTRQLVCQQNRKNKNSGGFQSMGLSRSVITGILRRGYKVPTPIQRKTIPLIMDGKDVVAMARTGSGKTAAFLIPMFERLITHDSVSGSRALVLSPTRELALQTLKFTKELGKYTKLKAAVILGGDRMDDQFEAMHNKPDVIIATPGRLMHVMVEMEMKLRNIEYVVFDEADRLFEMGFKEQLHEIIHRLPESRQTLLFSATLPKILIEFTRAGLQDPTLIRLDVDSKLSEQLQTSYYLCRIEDKPSALIYLLRNVISPEQQVVVFTSTMHHVEYVNLILGKLDLPYTYIYSSMDQAARKISLGKFNNKKCMILVVTDIAARGLDIPTLDVVINFNFPSKSKLFVHRVGRVARAGRSGVAYSFVSPDEMPYLLDLHLFLGRSLQISADDTTMMDGLCGTIPRSILDEGEELLQTWKNVSHEFMKAEETASKAYIQYLKSRPAPSNESIRRVKEFEKDHKNIGSHPVFNVNNREMEEKRQDLLARMKYYKPNTTIFEINSTSRQQAMPIMKKKRLKHEEVIQQNRRRLEKHAEDAINSSDPVMNVSSNKCSNKDIDNTFKVIIGPQMKRYKDKRQIRDDENYLHYLPGNFKSELGLSLKGSFEIDAANATMDVTADNTADLLLQRKQAKWDRKRKRFIQTGGNTGKNKKIKTESGTWIQASYKSTAYKDWLKRTKIAEHEQHLQESGEEDDAPITTRTPDSYQGVQVLGTQFLRWKNQTKKKTMVNMDLKTSQKGGGKLRNPDQILKERKRKDRIMKFQKTRRFKREKSRGRRK